VVRVAVRQKLLVGLVTFAPVASRAQPLEVIHLVTTPTAERDNVVELFVVIG
jgi:hypothetical protein